MKKTNKAFTLVELLVVITIIAILWVVAYTSFWWATDKAKSAAKMQNVNAIVTSLSQYKVEKWFYPWVADNTNNVWWYTSLNASKTNTTNISSDADWKLTAAWWTITWNWWWDVKDTTWTTNIWKKWTLWYSWDIKKYLKNDAYDNQIWDLTLDDWTKLISKWVGRFPYAIQWTWNKWNAYNLAYTVKDKDWKEKAVVVWDFNETSCTNCPNTLIWDWSDQIKDWDTASVPYSLNF
jgi:prepilin-type N-terminal cleavage/methylation domain-containing protein